MAGKSKKQDWPGSSGYLIISGTNRKDSNTEKIARYYQETLDSQGIYAPILSLENLDLSGRNDGYRAAEQAYLIPAQKFIIIAPEYNGSIPGVLKTLMDLSDYKKVWWNKKALLTGVSTGRSGNVRGMEHLTTILNYLKVVVHPNKLPISIVDKLLDADLALADQATREVIQKQVKDFLHF